MRIKCIYDEQSNMTWAVKVVEPGDFFGLDPEDINSSEHNIVEFYDTSAKVTDLGRFVSCQRLDTLLSDYAHNLQDLGHQIGGIGAQALKATVQWLQSRFLVAA